MEIISKELLSEVLEEADGYWEINKFKLVRENELYIELSTFDEDQNQISINIHELAHKCKEWAIDEGYNIQLMPFCVLVTHLESEHQQVFRYEDKDMKNQKPFLPDYEFKACQWILENKPKD